uniref:G-protein coupled receptors family 1 profile domain-containing protein n=1 Tax=Nannospalax galili TaxID=1026970 RepID=A0A8C6QRM9_NANGA
MGHNNITDFVLLGLSQDPAVQKALFAMFLFMYIVTMAGNLLIVVTVIAKPSLGSPVYFFFAYLSLMDALILDLFCDTKTISFTASMGQLFVEHLFCGTEIFLLVVMVYDHYVAICRPMHYLTIVNQRVCVLLLVSTLVGGFGHSMAQVLFVYNLPFCGLNVIDHFVCDMYPLLGPVCVDTYFLGLTVIANDEAICMAVFIILLASYGVILNSLKTHSQEGRHKALSTCSSHIIVVICFFVPCISVITPMLNHLIYTLRNSEIKSSIHKLWHKILGTNSVRMSQC